MKTLKFFFTACLLLTLMVVKSQNACFGTYVIIAEGSFYPDVRFTPYYSLNANWRVDSATWHFGDGTTLTSFSTYILHDYSANPDSLVDVCLVVTATDTINNISCTDTICRSVELCNPGINNSVNTIVNGATLSLGSYMSLYPGGVYPVTQTFDYGDGSANATHTFNANGNTMLSHTYSSSGVYVLNVSSLTGSGCIKDTSIIITVASGCNVNASFTYAQVSGNTYQFTNTSSSSNGLSAANLWTFSNNNGSIGFAYNSNNPSFTFSGPLPYSAKILVRDSSISGCADSIEFAITPDTCATTAAFTYTQVSGNTYQFTNTSGSNNGYTSDWTFIANGVYEGSSTVTNPQYTFTGSEPYTAVLRIGDLILPCDDSIHVAVDTPNACNIAADFTYTANANGTVSFTNTSTSANPLSTNWYYYAPNYIGFDIDPNPHRSFLGFNGPYSAMLIVIDSTTMCRDTIVKTLAVTIPPCSANASFTYQFTNANTVAFTNTSGSNNGYWSIWTFSNSSGPFSGSNANNPVVTLSGAAPYSAKLEVRDSAGGVCFDTVVQQLNVQTTCITLRPGSEGIDALASEILADSSLGSYHPDLNISQWTYGGINKETRALLKYDLSMIPAGATITSAKLSLYAATATSSAYPGQPTYGSNNASYIKQITAPWGESTVTWNNQPTTTTTGQVLLAQAGNAAQSYLNIDIQPFVQNWVNNPAQNYGMMMDMITTNFYNALIFGSSDNPDSTLHPKLEICYTIPLTSCITLRPGSEGIDALASEILADSSLGSYHPDLNMSQWTYGGINKETRALLKYDLSAIPAGATITSARLSLYAATNTASAYPGQPTYGSNNASYIKQITAPWGEATVTWNNQPTTTTTGQVLLAQAGNAAQSYINIDIQPFVQNWVNNPAQNYGMMMDMITTNFYNALIFGSSDNPDSTLHPKLEICYIAGNQCGINAGYTYTTSNDTAILANTSTPTGAIGSYEVIARYASTGASYSYATGSFNAVRRIKLPQDSIMNVCLVAHDTSGTCVDTFCNIIGIWQPCAVVAGFTFTQSGSAVLVYNTSTGNYPPLTYQWQAPGAWPSSSTATDTAFYFSQPGIHQICLIATNAIGCKDTFCTSINNTPTDTLCGMVYVDANSNGIYDVNEQVRPNSTIHIDGNVFITDSTGFYRAPVITGAHVVALAAPPGWVQTYPDTPLVYNITTATGEYICGLDFGMRDDTLTLSGITYFDNNGNGLYDTGDQLRPNVMVTVAGINGTITIYSDSLGYYSVMVYSGTYTVTSPVPSNHSATQPVNSNTYTITAYASSIAGINFGVRNNAVTISGKVYVDANNNGVYDSGEVAVSNQPVVIGGTTVYTNSSGNYSVNKPTGTYVVTYTPTGNYTAYASCTVSSITVNAVGGSVFTNNNFGLCISPGTGDVCLTLAQMTNVTPALGLARYQIRLQNYGNIPMSGTLEMNFDPLLIYHSSNYTPASVNPANYNIIWNFTVAVGQVIYVYPVFSVPSTAVLGTNVFNHAFFNPDAGFVDVNMACNEDTLHQQVLASYDPNDKYVSPIGQGSSHAIRNVGQKLDYTIMFQNTGNAPAVNVILLDTVEADLDIASFVMKDASHDYHVQIEGREITWIFNNIMLPDSNTNVDSSIGFVSFSMNALTGLTDGSMVTNRAGIYFDYNEVVATGTAFNTIDKTTSISEIESGIDIALQPNPFTTYTNLIINGANDKWPYMLQVYDMTGRVVQQATSMNNIIRIERSGMAQGIYMYEVKQNNKLIGKGKMIAE